MERRSVIQRQTSETDITVSLDLDGSGLCSVHTGVPFFDHMLSMIARHGFVDLDIQATGDLDVDYHHTVEDVGICLGQAWHAEGMPRLGQNRQGIKAKGAGETRWHILGFDASDRGEADG